MKMAAMAYQRNEMKANINIEWHKIAWQASIK